MDDTIEGKEKEIHKSLLKVVTAKMDKNTIDPNIITAAMECMLQGGR